VLSQPRVPLPSVRTHMVVRRIPELSGTRLSGMGLGGEGVQGKEEVEGKEGKDTVKDTVTVTAGCSDIAATLVSAGAAPWPCCQVALWRVAP